MPLPSFPALQNRWQVQNDNNQQSLVYYGLRNPPLHTKSIIPIDNIVAQHIRALNGEKKSNDLPAELLCHPQFAKLINEKIIVDKKDIRQPATKETKQQCTRCINDDHLLPGLEFNADGLCAFCQCYERAEKSGIPAGPQNFITEEELLEAARNNTQSRFDVMVLCTGGKDSTYLLWLLAKKLGLRVLAVSWNMPYTNETCKENLRHSVKLLPSVELVERTLPWDLISQAMREQFAEIGVPCLCPTVAHVLFFPMAVQEKIPFIMQGVEEVQLAVASYVMNELKSGKAAEEPSCVCQRDMTLGFFNMVAHTPSPERPYAITSEFLRYQRSVRQRLNGLYGQLDETLKKAKENPSLPIPEFRRLKTNTTYGTWSEVAQLIKTEMEWQMPPGHKGLLHTSCKIEQVKDYCQLMRFKNMRSTFFPQSIVEVSAGIFFGLITRREGLTELENLGYFGEPEPMSSLLNELGITRKEIETAGEMPYSFCSCKSCK